MRSSRLYPAGGRLRFSHLIRGRGACGSRTQPVKGWARRVAGMSGFGEAGTAKYVSLTTFRKDGTPVATPLWAALDGDRLVLWTRTESWKVSGSAAIRR